MAAVGRSGREVAEVTIVDDRVFVQSLLAAVGYDLEKQVRSYLDPADAQHQAAASGSLETPSAWESLRQALSATVLNMGALVDFPQVVEIRVSNRFANWRITADGSQWRAERLAGRGRPRRDPSIDRRILAEYKRIHQDARTLHRELRDCYKNLDRPKKRRPETRRKLGECYLADCNPRWLSSLVGPSEDGETAVLAWKPQGTGSKIDWLEFLAGEFAPRDLALSYLGKELGLAPSTIANILKSKKKTARK